VGRDQDVAGRAATAPAHPITTAGSDPFSIAGEIHDYAEKVRDGVIDDPSFYPVIYGAPRGADWTSEKTWAMCNPGLNATVKLDYLRQECRTAQSSPVYENTFRQLHLNRWVSSSAQWNAAWAGCAGPVDPAALVGRACVAGLDLSEGNDLSALGLLFPDESGGYAALPFFWCREEDIRRRAERDHAPYQERAADGFLRPTLGNLVDHEVIAERIRELGRRYAIREIGFDPWHDRQFAARLAAEGIPMIEVPQSKQALSPVAHELERLVLSGGLRHGDHQVLAWCVSNAVAKVDHLEDIVITKAGPSARIDGVSALLMALSRAIVQPADEDSELDARAARGDPRWWCCDTPESVYLRADAIDHMRAVRGHGSSGLPDPSPDAGVPDMLTRRRGVDRMKAQLTPEERPDMKKLLLEAEPDRTI
jgi:phage terminase large subunit-like protein